MAILITSNEIKNGDIVLNTPSAYLALIETNIDFKNGNITAKIEPRKEKDATKLLSIDGVYSSYGIPFDPSGGASGTDLENYVHDYIITQIEAEQPQLVGTMTKVDLSFV
jgi:hypothetical protein